MTIFYLPFNITAFTYLIIFFDMILTGCFVFYCLARLILGSFFYFDNDVYIDVITIVVEKSPELDYNTINNDLRIRKENLRDNVFLQER